MQAARRRKLEEALSLVDERLAEDPNRRLDLEARGRLMRELNIDGWQIPIGRLANLRSERLEGNSANLRLTTAYLRWVAGPSVDGGDDGANLRQLIADYLPLLNQERPHAQSAAAFIVAAFLVGDDETAIELATRLPNSVKGPAVTLVGETAAARQKNDEAALRDCRDKWRKRAKAEPVDSTAIVPTASDVLLLLDAVIPANEEDDS